MQQKATNTWYYKHDDIKCSQIQETIFKKIENPQINQELINFKIVWGNNLILDFI